jgi:hypothetical protein
LQSRRNVVAAGIKRLTGISLSQRISEQFVRHNIRTRRAL